MIHELISSWTGIDSQPSDLRGITEKRRDSIIVHAIQVNGRWVITSYYGDDIWQVDGFTSNVGEHSKRLDFTLVPHSFRSVMKAVLYRYMRRGREGTQPPKGTTLVKFLINIQLFLRYLVSLNIEKLQDVTPAVCESYIEACRTHRQKQRSNKPLSQQGLAARLLNVEALYELSQFTEDSMPQHPWPESSPFAIAGLAGRGSQICKTPLIPDKVFCTLFERAYELVQLGSSLLDLRDELAVIAKNKTNHNSHSIWQDKSRHLLERGSDGRLTTFNKALLRLRTACYIILASTSGCRNHELANLKIGAHRRTQDDEGTIYHWMRSRSEKTDAGIHDWMIPEIGVKVLRLMERWSAPFHVLLDNEIGKLQKSNPYNPLITNLQAHRHTLFLGEKDNKVRTLTCVAWRMHLEKFANELGLDWKLGTHQFRRKFANYVAHSKFGDLRYLRDHFAHWGMDMSLGYAMDSTWGQHLDLELFDDIQSELEGIKIDVVGSWFDEDMLAGGYGADFKSWQRTPANLMIFKSRHAMLKAIAESTAIRHNGHAWCTADDNRCIGNTLEKTRCGNCDNAVIGQRHRLIHQHLYKNLKELLNSSGIGEAGRQRVLRDMYRCRDVLKLLGFDPQENET
ncbi:MULTISPECIES: integrase [unclassified Pseudomonas]|uniref:integrase n=1 Tax=unclassified Pseudomonas TaxID=196821 RepID=UPI000A1DB667|nr:MULTISPECIES: integrase [unclassified Pseudomonas]